MLKEVGAYVEVAVHFLAEQSVVGHECESHGVPCGSAVDGVGSCPVAFEVAHGNVRLHRHSLHDYAVGAVVAGDGLVGACICERTSDFEPVGQIVVEVEARVETREVRPDYRTVLFHPAGAHGVDSLVIAAVDTDLMVLHESSAEDFVLPVRTASEEGNVAESLVEVSFAEHSLCKELLLIKGIFAQVHHVETLVDLLPCHVAVISDICMSCRSATGGHKHYAVGTGGAVDCAGRRVFKHVDADDVGGAMAARG